MDTGSAPKFSHADRRGGASGEHHRQRASACILTALLAVVLAAHMVELDAALLQMLAALGRSCVWCAVTPY